jgi:transposase
VKVATIRGAWARVISWLRKLGRPFKVCFEASTGYGFMFDELSKIAACVKVAHPGHLRMIFRSKRKNDRVDAAKLMYFDDVPEVHVPAADVRAWRQMITFRHRLVARRTAVKNQTRALLRSLGVRAPRGLWSRRGREWLAGHNFAPSSPPRGWGAGVALAREGGSDMMWYRRWVLVAAIRGLRGRRSRRSRSERWCQEWGQQRAGIRGESP